MMIPWTFKTKKIGLKKYVSVYYRLKMISHRLITTAHFSISFLRFQTLRLFLLPLRGFCGLRGLLPGHAAFMFDLFVLGVVHLLLRSKNAGQPAFHSVYRV